MARKNAPEIPAELIAAARTCTVRECDETAPATFVAYVDEGSDTFDTTVTFKKDTPDSSACDCGTPQPCRHAAALLLFLAGEKTIKPAAKVKKAKTAKSSPTADLLDEVDPAALRDWLRGVFPQHKELEMAFLHHFRNKEEALTPAAAAELTANAVKTVMGRTRIPDTTALKKIVTLWQELHGPVLRRYAGGMSDPDAFLPLQAALDACMDFWGTLRSGGARIQTYIDKSLAGLQAGMAALALEETFLGATGLFIDNLFRKDELRVHYLQFLINLTPQLPADRQKALATRLAAWHRRHPVVRWDKENVIYQRAILHILQTAGVFPEYADRFHPITHANNYNHDLIRALESTGNTEAAATAAWTCISSNSRAEYDLDYLEILQRMHEAAGDQRGLIRLAAHRLPIWFRYEDYRTIADSLPPEGKLAFRHDTLLKARQFRTRPAACNLTFELYAEDNNREKMLQLAGRAITPYSVILKHLDFLLAGDKDRFLDVLLSRELSAWGEDEETDALPALISRLQEAYGAKKLNDAARSYRYRAFGFPAIVRWILAL